MSKIKLTGSNSGYVEIDSAADAGNLTLQLPTSGTRLLSDAGNVFTGITTTGELDVNGKIDVSTDIVLGRNLKVTGITTLSNDVILKGGSYDVLWDSSDNALEFGTNAKATFGGAMQLYHDGSNSLIQDSGTGHVQIRSGTFTVGNAGLTKTSAIFNSGSGQQLNFNNNQKFITTNTGVVVTGICTATSFSGSGEGLTRTTQLSHRNKVINGAMQVAQRGTSVSIGSDSSTYLIDRFAFRRNNISDWVMSQSTESPDGFSNSIKMDVTSVTTGMGVSRECGIYYRFEGQDLQDIAKGTSVAKELTLSFYVKCNKNGTYNVELMDLDNSNRHVNKSYTVSNNNWTKHTITFPADTTGVMGNDNNASLEIYFWLAASNNFKTSARQETWGTLNQGARATGQANLADSTSNEWYITGVQLEVGSVATPFEHRSFSDELARCQRYFYRVSTTASGTGQYKHIGTMQYYGSRYPYGKILDLPVPMRTIPTGSHTGTVKTWTAGGSTNGSVTTINYDRNDNKFLGSNGCTTDTGNGGSGDATPITLWTSSSMSADAEL